MEAAEIWSGRPEVFGYPGALAVMGLAALALYVMFKKKEWL